MLQAIKLFLQGPESVEEILNDYPEFLQQISQLLKAYGQNLIIYNEACQILKKVMINHKAQIPEELDDFIANITDSEEDLTEPIQLNESPNRYSQKTLPTEKSYRNRNDLNPVKISNQLFQPVVISDKRNSNSVLKENNDYYFNNEFQPYQSQPALVIPQRKKKSKQQNKAD